MLVHGGMAQDVGPILEMVTEKYLLRSEAEWRGRQEAIALFDQIVDLLRAGDVRGHRRGHHAQLLRPAPDHHPLGHQSLHRDADRAGAGRVRRDFWGFWMLGGMSGGGMGFIFDPARQAEAQERLQRSCPRPSASLETALPFAMEPVVYDFAINEQGTCAELRTGNDALMPPGYYTLTVPALLRAGPPDAVAHAPGRAGRFGAACRTQPELSGMVQTLFDQLLPQTAADGARQRSLSALLAEHGFDRIQHEQIRADLRSGRIGLAQNRLPVSTKIEDVQAGRCDRHRRPSPKRDAARLRELGMDALAEGEVAVVTLAAGAGSRWTQGAGVVKALQPVLPLGGRHRTFLEVHLAKSRRIGRLAGTPLPHVITTSYLTHEPIAAFLARAGRLWLSGAAASLPGRAVGLRLVPMARDLRFAWEEMPQQLLDEQAQKVHESLHAALIGWAQQHGRGQRLHRQPAAAVPAPGGPLVSRSPTCCATACWRELLAERPQLQYLLLHNIDTLGADVDPVLLGQHIDQGARLTIEVITRRVEDRGGGLARVDGQLRLIEGLALPREEDEFKLSYYNSNTIVDRHRPAAGRLWPDARRIWRTGQRVAEAVRALAARMPTYITLKDVKKRWGHGQEDIFPVAQFEKLWGDMTALPEMDCRFVVVPAAARAAAQGAGPARRLAARWLGGVRGGAVRVGVGSNHTEAIHLRRARQSNLRMHGIDFADAGAVFAGAVFTLLTTVLSTVKRDSLRWGCCAT